MATVLVVLAGGIAWAQSGFFRGRNRTVFSSISYSGAGPHIKSLSTSSTITVDNPITLLGTQAAGASAADIIAKPTNASRIGAVFETQSSTGTAAVQMYDTGRVASSSSANFNYLAKSTNTSNSGFEFKDSANATVGAIGFAGLFDQGVYQAIAGDTVQTFTNDWWAGKYSTGKPGTFTGSKVVFTNTVSLTNCDAIPLADDTVYNLEIFITGRRSDGTEARAIWWLTNGAYRVGGGGATLLGTTLNVAAVQQTGLHTMAIAVGVNANNVRIRVQTTVLAHPNYWSCFWIATPIGTA
jgi:hypothetical protein